MVKLLHLMKFLKLKEGLDLRMRLLGLMLLGWPRKLVEWRRLGVITKLRLILRAGRIRPLISLIILFLLLQELLKEPILTFSRWATLRVRKSTLSLLASIVRSNMSKLMILVAWCWWLIASYTRVASLFQELFCCLAENLIEVLLLFRKTLFDLSIKLFKKLLLLGRGLCTT